MKFQDVKLNDSLLVSSMPGHGHVSYYVGTVIRVTKTRFTVSYSDKEQVFTKDGYEFPRAHGWNRSHIEVNPFDEAGAMLVRKHRMANKARNLAHKLNDIFGNANYREQIFKQSLEGKELEENIALLEQVYERFKKYGPQEA